MYQFYLSYIWSNWVGPTQLHFISWICFLWVGAFFLLTFLMLCYAVFFFNSLSSCPVYPLVIYVVYVWTGWWLISLVLVTSDNKGLLLHIFIRWKSCLQLNWVHQWIIFLSVSVAKKMSFNTLRRADSLLWAALKPDWKCSNRLKAMHPG